MKTLLSSLLLAGTCLMGTALAACPPAGHDQASLRALSAAKFLVDDPAERQRIALELVDCLADPDAELRDDIAYRAYATWMRAGVLAVATLRQLSSTLQSRIAPTFPDAGGFGKPFAALVLSEVARTDRIAPWMTVDEREGLVASATHSLASVRDYRGFIDRQGWRHGVAHGADVMLQLSLNKELDKAQLDRLLSAIAIQVPAHGGHAYRHGEPERLAAPVFHIAKRGLHTSEQWMVWLLACVQPPPGMTADDVYRSEAALAWRNNVQAFVLQLYVNVNESGDAQLKALFAPAVLAALKKLP